MHLIFDESQKEGNNEVWIDMYPLTRFMAKHTQAAVKVEGTKEWGRTVDIVDPAVEEYDFIFGGWKGIFYDFWYETKNLPRLSGISMEMRN